MSSENPPGADFVQALARGLGVIECFDEDHARMTLSEVARRTSLTRPSARRALLTLQKLGYVTADGDRFMLTARTLRLGYAYLSSEPLWDLAKPHLDHLRHETAQSCSIGVFDGDEVVVVARSAAKRVINDEVGVGFRWPAYCTALGRVLLGALTRQELDAYFARTQLKRLTPRTVISAATLGRAVAQSRAQGWAVSDLQVDIEMRSISVPILGKQGRIIAAINASGRAHLIDMAGMEKQYLPALQRAAAAISAIAVSRSPVG